MNCGFEDVRGLGAVYVPLLSQALGQEGMKNNYRCGTRLVLREASLGSSRLLKLVHSCTLTWHSMCALEDAEIVD